MGLQLRFIDYFTFMQTKLLREIQGAYDNLRKSEKLVADFILKHPADVVDSTMAQAAEKMSVSEPTLNRFCKALNYSGFNLSLIHISEPTRP